MKHLLLIISLWSLALITKAQQGFNFSKFTKFSSATYDLSEGEYIIGVFNTNCDHCQETASKLSELKNDKIPEILALFYNEIPEVNPTTFSAKTNTNYPYIVIGDDDFWQLIKNSPPALYHIKDNKIIKFYEGDEIASNIDEDFK